MVADEQQDAQDFTAGHDGSGTGGGSVGAGRDTRVRRASVLSTLGVADRMGGGARIRERSFGAAVRREGRHRRGDGAAAG